MRRNTTAPSADGDAIDQQGRPLVPARYLAPCQRPCDPVDGPLCLGCAVAYTTPENDDEEPVAGT